MQTHGCRQRKDARIDKLESQINDLEQNSKKKNVIITGLNMHTYATTLTNATTTGHSTQHSNNNEYATILFQNQS